MTAVLRATDRAIAGLRLAHSCVERLGHRRLHPREHRRARLAALEVVAVGQDRAFRRHGAGPVRQRFAASLS